MRRISPILAGMTATAQRITEQVYSGEDIRVDEKEGVIYNVRVLGPDSKNGRFYSERARTEAREKYEGVDVNISHRKEDDNGEEREFLEGIGILTRPREGKDGAVYADLPYLKTHPLAPVIVERAQRFPKTFGLSHSADGDVIPGGHTDGRDLVETIHHVESVDFVRKPATNNGLFESQRSKPMKSTVLKVLEKALTGKPDHAEGSRLKKLLESQEMTAVAGAPADEAVSGDAESQIGAAFEQAVVAVLRSGGDKASKLAQIKKILAAEESLAGGGDSKPAAGGESAAVAESVKKLAESVATLTRRETIRGLCVSEGVQFDTLSAEQRTLLEGQKDDASVKTILESMPRLPVGPKPTIRSKVTESAETGSYDEMVKRRGF